MKFNHILPDLKKKTFKHTLIETNPPFSPIQSVVLNYI